MASKATSPPDKAKSSSGNARGLGEWLTWLLLVVIVPLLVGVLAIGGALQFIGIPVWQTTLQVTGLHKKKSLKPSASNQKVIALQSQVQHLTSQNTQLKQTNLQSKQDNVQLKAKMSILQKQLNVTVNDAKAGQQEAKVLTAMDATAAANILVKMGVAKASWVVAAMSAKTSGKILQNAPTNFTTSVIQNAAADSLKTAKLNGTLSGKTHAQP